MDTGWLTAGGARNIAFAGGSGWLNCNNAKTSNDSWSTSSLDDHEKSARLNVYNFGADVSGTINGIEVRVERHHSDVKDKEIYLMDDTTPKGSDKGEKVVHWPSSDGWRTYGGSSDLWGTSWTPTQINASTFGIVLRAENCSSGTRTASVDCMQVKIYYTPLSNDHLMIMGM